MGKPYDLELSQLPTTYQWATEVPVERLAASLQSAGSTPLVALGSGGSFTTADFAAALHREFTGKLATPMTLLEATAPSLDLRSISLLLATAGGKNPDALDGLRTLAVREPCQFIVLCTAVGSPLARAAAKYGFIDFIEFQLPSGKDGFLATNSLLASAVLLTRAYHEAFGVKYPALPKFAELLDIRSREDYATEFDGLCGQLWQKDTLVVLYGPSARSAAIDIESKFTEAGLGNVQLADYRQFAHGRHHWLAKRSATTAVLAFVTPNDESIASRTLAFIPPAIPVLRMDIAFSGMYISIAALTRVFYIVRSASRARGIDPGRPGVPGFGRRIYHLRALNERTVTIPVVSPEEKAAIERKSRRTVAALASVGQLEAWQEAYAAFTRRLAKAIYGGVVFDYDGTLCDEADRFAGLSSAIGTELARLLRAGAVLGFATGRGKSVKESLRECIAKKYWGRVAVGYYNGGEIGRLDQDTRPDGRETVSAPLRPIADALTTHPGLRGLAKFELRLPQVKVEAVNLISAELVGGLVQQIVYGHAVPGVVVVRSGHSLDVLAPGVSKQTVLAHVTGWTGLKKGSSILCIGDQGQWPGNDFSLLASPFALSADEASRDPATCWNLAPPGDRHVCATLTYLRSLQPAEGGLRFVWRRRARRKT